MSKIFIDQVKPLLVGVPRRTIPTMFFFAEEEKGYLVARHVYPECEVVIASQVDNTYLCSYPDRVERRPSVPVGLYEVTTLPEKYSKRFKSMFLLQERDSDNVELSYMSSTYHNALVKQERQLEWLADVRRDCARMDHLDPFCIHPDWSKPDLPRFDCCVWEYLARLADGLDIAVHPLVRIFKDRILVRFWDGDVNVAAVVRQPNL